MNPTAVADRRRLATRLAASCVAVASVTGCAMLLGNPNTELGQAQDRHYRKINAQYDPGMPAKLRTDYAARGAVVDDDAAAREWGEFFDLFRWRPASVPFRDEPSRCPDPDAYLSCSATQGCECRARGRSRSAEPASPRAWSDPTAPAR